MKYLIFMLLPLLACGASWSGRGSRGCPQKCPPAEVDPVCGSDGVIYQSICDLKRITCGNSVYIVPDDRCLRSAGASCESTCSSLYDPVCASDGRTYRNMCIYRVEQCRSGVAFAHYGLCIEATNLTSTACPTVCSDVVKDGPVCGSDGNVYESDCELRLRTCGQKVVRTSRNHCQTTRDCEKSCPYSFKPVCGSDGRIYQSKCTMKVKNCGRHIFETPMVHCRPQERSPGGCPISCEGIPLSPVCGSDGNLYDSDCDMERLTCGAGSQGFVFAVVLEKCRKKFETCERTTCPHTPDPVCGTDGNTYTNYCLLYKATCKKGVELAHYGVCPNMNEIDDCPVECPPKEQYIVCGSDGNIYPTICEMKRRTCGQKVVPVALHHCAATKNCYAKCNDRDNVAVCGSDNKLYRNACEMKAKNCGTHVYEVPMKRCVNAFSFTRCQQMCDTSYNPVCGTDGKTYTNECFLEMEKCRSRSMGRSLVNRIHHGKCGQPVPEAKLYMFR